MPVESTVMEPSPKCSVVRRRSRESVRDYIWRYSVNRRSRTYSAEETLPESPVVGSQVAMVSGQQHTVSSSLPSHVLYPCLADIASSCGNLLATSPHLSANNTSEIFEKSNSTKKDQFLLWRSTLNKSKSKRIPKERGAKLPRLQVTPCQFIPSQKIVPVDTDDETHQLFVDAFLHNNRLEHMIQVIGYHPKYLDLFLKTQQYILRGDGPLPYDYRHYIAIMAAARHQCSYLVNLQTTEFLLQNGDERWLKGLEYVPKKLRNLCEMNKILAHRPWLINKAHIEKLAKGEDAWSLSELMHAIVLFAHFHALSSFVFGCGISPEVDHEEGHSYSPSSTSNQSSPNCKSSGGVPVNLSTSQLGGSTNNSPQQNSSNTASELEGGIVALMERMQRLTEVQEEMSQEELQERFERIEKFSAELPAASVKPSLEKHLLCFIEDPDFTYQDFAKRGNEIPTFRAQDYSWEDHGFSLANRLYTDIGSLLDEKFQVASTLTYHTMGDNQDVDTSSFRCSIWNYIHCMFGIRHDDYDYAEVNQLLERSLKAYIKTVSCFPERITRSDYNSFMHEFKHSEKVHVNLMLLEARLQAELLYALRAIMRYMT